MRDQHQGAQLLPAPRRAPLGTAVFSPRREAESRRLIVVLTLALLAAAVEAIGGWAANSLALLSDAGHMLADAGAIGLSLFALRVGTRPADAKRTYGYYRLEILAALLNGALLIAIAVGIGIEAWRRLLHPQPLDLRMIVGLALVGIALNLAGLWLTHAGGRGSMNLRSTFLHLAGDLLNSLGVLAAAAIIALTGRKEADPLIGFVIAATIVWSAIRLCREAVDVLLEGFPRHLDFAEVQSALGAVGGVAAVHDLHVWTITSGLVALSCHIVVVCEGPGCRSHDQILTDAKKVLKDRFQIEHTTIQFEGQSFQHDEFVH